MRVRSKAANRKAAATMQTSVCRSETGPTDVMTCLGRNKERKKGNQCNIINVCSVRVKDGVSKSPPLRKPPPRA